MWCELLLINLSICERHTGSDFLDNSTTFCDLASHVPNQVLSLENYKYSKENEYTATTQNKMNFKNNTKR